ncbi:MAG: hypothetical protein V2A34_10830 [Lentisphaerota bacterium]
MMKKTALLFILILWVLRTPTARAINVDPTRLILNLEQGASYQGAIQIINPATEPMGIDVSIQDETRNNRSVTSLWYSADDHDLDLPPQSTTAYPFSIQVPAQAEGELHLKISFAEKRARGSGPVTVIPVLAVPIYVQVKNTERYEPVILDLFLKSNDPLTIGMTVENKGNVQIRPIALCKITRKGTDELAAVLYINKQNQNDIGWPIFPKKKDVLLGRVSESSPYPKSLEPGAYTLETSLEINGQEYHKSAEVTIE